MIDLEAMEEKNDALERQLEETLNAVGQLQLALDEAKAKVKELEALEGTCPRCGMQQVKVG